MTQRRREIETLLLTSFAAVPLYLSQAIGPLPLVLFHAVMAGIIVRVATGRSPELIPAPLMRGIAVAYVFFYFVDAALISRSAIAASTHLVLFIATYQPIESTRTKNQAQRLLTTALIFVASIATSTHITIVLFVVAFGFGMFRQLMYLSHMETVSSIGRDYAEPPSGRAAAFYLGGTALVAALLFPVVPRVRNPMVEGSAGALANATTGLSDSIDFSRDRAATPDATVVARVWMSADTVPFFTPLRLRGAVYDRFSRNQWRQTLNEGRDIRPSRSGVFRIARPIGFTRAAHVQQNVGRNTRLLVPTGTYAIQGVPQLYVGPAREAYSVPLIRAANDLITYDVSLAREIEPLTGENPRVVNYPASPAVQAMARRIVGDARDPLEQASRLEHYLLTHFQYVANTVPTPGPPMTVDEFLLNKHRGHCEYFAAGMVALLATLDVPARIVGGFYGGRLNPLTGYFVVRREDAHAWAEVWNGSRWTTFDATPPDLRPGNLGSGLVSMYANAVGDTVTFFWDRYVLTYGLGDQIRLAADLIDAIRGAMGSMREHLQNPRGALASRGFLTTFGVLLALGAIAVVVARRRRPVFDLLADQLRAYGIDVGRSMTMEEALAELRSTRPDAARELEPIIAMYEAERFSPNADAERRRDIRRRLLALRT